MKNTFIKIAKYIPRKIKRKLLGNSGDIINARLNHLECIINGILRLEGCRTDLNFQGQVSQDFIAYKFFKGKTEGFYIDIGANDGVTINNTAVFEQIGWKGICVEPIPEVFNRLKKNRACDCYNTAIAAESSDSVEFIKADYTGSGEKNLELLSGLSSEITEIHKKRILNETGTLKKIQVKTLSFHDLMNNYPGRKHIDFMSIDVEGAEMSILKTINFKEYSFGLITVENNEKIEGEMKKYMTEQGYEVYLDLGLDIMFIPVAR